MSIPSAVDTTVSAPGTSAEAERHQQAALVAETVIKHIYRIFYNQQAPQNTVPIRKILESEPRFQIEVILAVLAQGSDSRLLEDLLEVLCVPRLPWTAEDIELLLTRSQTLAFDWKGEVRPVTQFIKAGGLLSPGACEILEQKQQTYADYTCAYDFKQSALLAKLLRKRRSVFPYSGDSWGALAIADILALPADAQNHWKHLFAYADDCEPTKPTSVWRKEGKILVDAVGAENFRAGVARWFAAVTLPSPGGEHDPFPTYGTQGNINLLKGLAWLCVDNPSPEVARGLAQLVLNCLKKCPGLGPWAVRTANAAIWALSEMECSEAIAQLSRLKLKVTSRSAILQIEKALETAAERAGVTKADLEDMSAPAYGFATDGIWRETFGDCQGIATIMPSGEIQVEWTGANGKPLKAPSAAVKKSHAAELKAFKAEVTAATTMLTAQKMRFDSFYLPERVWTLRQWRERFAEHPLLGSIARRLIWQFREQETQGEGIWNGDRQGFVEITDQPLLWLTEETEVRLWHPIGRGVEEVVAWRNYLQERRIMQPFKQAYREVYLLTDAERRTATYSNRFAAHIVKQHQMHSLATLRGWRQRLHVMADDYFPPATKLFPEQGLRAEFWIGGVGENYGADTTEAGAYLYLASDQVRFYPLDAPVNSTYGDGYATMHQGRFDNPLTGVPLTEVPALVFSEVMRDVDLFVGVCSIGNDPAWQDGGPQGIYSNYWNAYASGELSATARTRRDVLERLLPRLKIAARCTLTEKFLVVRGDLRTYKIHLGSANILMEPNDQYLCIVQDRSAGTTQTAVPFLPFEGDQRLTLILSKALMLAEDTRITDLTITSQIKPT